MTLKKCILTANDCYKKNQKMIGNKPTGIVVHSTGANNKTLKRYVQPLKTDADYATIIADLGVNAYGNHWNRSAAEMNRSVCVHAFIGINAAGKVETYQTLPFDICCWGVGSGSKGSYNYNPQARVQFEICEDALTDETYFNEAFKEAVEFCAYLCKMYGFGVDKISSHRESHLAGYGGNHGDCDHWLKKFGKDMDWFRAQVQAKLGTTQTETPAPTVTPVVGTVSTGSAADEKKIWDYLKGKIGNEYGVAGLMGNLYAESGLRSNNVENCYESKLGFNDSTYTSAVDNGTYDNFVKDSAGYGLAQWTYWTRKQNLLNYANSKKRSIGDFTTQLEFLYQELATSYKVVLSDLNNATSVLEASNSVLTKFERPANQGESVQKQRAAYGQKYYDKYATKTSASTTPVTPTVPTTNALLFKAGDIVNFTGTKHYANANATSGATVKASKAKITSVYKTGKHPYHCRAVNDAGNFIGGVYGWVDAADVSAIETPSTSIPNVTTPAVTSEIKKGSVVSIASGARYYSGSAVPAWVIAKQWIVVEDPKGDRAVIDKSTDGKHSICSPINTKYLTVVSTENTKADEPWTPTIGDTVIYNGSVHYSNANSAQGIACKGGKAKITNIYRLGKSKHPYHLVRVSGSGATVYGWVDANTFTKV